MNWFESVWLYCERGTSAALLAEPVNALSTLSFLIAGLSGVWIYRNLPLGQKSADHSLFIGLTFLVGLGGLSFHLFANQWSELAHLLPLLLFMMVYLAFALNRFLKLPPGWTILVISLFVMATIAAMTMACSFVEGALQPAWSMAESGFVGQSVGATSCLNGSFAYLPALVVLAVLGLLLRARKHKAASSLLLAATLFFMSLIFHTLDPVICSRTVVAGHKSGLHFVWHLLNAIWLFILLRSSMLYQERPLVHEILSPDVKWLKRL